MDKIPHRLDSVDYYGRRIYHVTMTTEGRRPLLGTLRGDPALPAGHPDGPRVEPSSLGAEVLACLMSIEHFHPHARLVVWQLMPDHLHFVLFITEGGGPHLGAIINGFKTGCNKAYRRLFPREAAAYSAAAVPPPLHPAATPAPAPEVAPVVGLAAMPQGSPVVAPITAPAAMPQGAHNSHRPTTEGRKHGMLWAASYYEVPLSGRNQLERMTAYVRDNPRRLLLKRLHRSLFAPFPLALCGMDFTAMGNSALLTAATMQAVRISRRTPPADLAALLERLLAQARAGTVVVSPFVSPGEEAVREALLADGLPYVRLDGYGFGPYYKPSAAECDAMAQGRLLLLAPWPYTQPPRHLGKAQFEALNAMAARIAATTVSSPPRRSAP